MKSLKIELGFFSQPEKKNFFCSNLFSCESASTDRLNARRDGFFCSNNARRHLFETISNNVWRHLFETISNNVWRHLFETVSNNIWCRLFETIFRTNPDVICSKLFRTTSDVICSKQFLEQTHFWNISWPRLLIWNKLSKNEGFLIRN
jgi:hypothetical protein